MKRLSVQEKSWIFYDWANSAYSILITTAVFPLYFKTAAHHPGISASTSTAYWGYANSIATLMISLGAPVLGTLVDYQGFKKRFFTFFFLLGFCLQPCLPLFPRKSG